MDSELAPIRIPRLYSMHERSFARNRVTVIAKVVIPEPRIPCSKGDLCLADRTPSSGLKNNSRISGSWCPGCSCSEGPSPPEGRNSQFPK